MRTESTADLPAVLAKNLAELRRTHGMTQAELAEQLGYSDKSVSKWERAEGIPDVLCLKKIADLFGVTVDYFLSAVHEETPSEDAEAVPETVPVPAGSPEHYVINYMTITLLAVAGVWLLAAAVFIILRLCNIRSCLPFVLAAPVTGILLVVFHALWGKKQHAKLFRFLAISFLVWTVLFAVCYLARAYHVWLLMILGIPSMPVIALACRVRIAEKADKRENNDSSS